MRVDPWIHLSTRLFSSPWQITQLVGGARNPCRCPLPLPSVRSSTGITLHNHPVLWTLTGQSAQAT